MNNLLSRTVKNIFQLNYLLNFDLMLFFYIDKIHSFIMLYLKINSLMIIK